MGLHRSTMCPLLLVHPELRPLAGHRAGEHAQHEAAAVHGTAALTCNRMTVTASAATWKVLAGIMTTTAPRSSG